MKRKKIKPTLNMEFDATKQYGGENHDNHIGHENPAVVYEESVLEGTLSTAKSKKNMKRSVVKQRAQSIFTFIGIAVMILIVPIFMVSVGWLITYILSTINDVYKIQSLSYINLKSQIDKVFDGPETVGNTLATRISYEGNGIANTTSFSFLKNQVEILLLANEKVFLAGLQLSYSSKEKLLGIKKVKEGDGVNNVLYVIWSIDEGLDELPDPGYQKNTLSYHNYINETTLDPTPTKVLPYGGFENSANYKRLLNTERNQYGIKAIYTAPSLVSCPQQDQQCSYVMQYITCIEDDPIKYGFFASQIQMPFLPDLLKNVTDSSEISFLVYTSDHSVVASSIESVDNYYEWDFAKGQHVVYTIDSFPIDEIKVAGQTLRDNFGDHFEGITGVESVIIQYPKLYRLTATKIKRIDVEFLLVHMISEWDYFQIPVFVAIGFLIFSLFLLAITLLGGCLTAYAIYKPLQLLIDNMDGITDGLNLERVRFGSTPFFSEFDQMQRTFEYLVEKLKLYRTFLPEHILNKVDDKLSDPGDIKLARLNNDGQQAIDQESMSNSAKPLDQQSLSSPRSSIGSTSSDGEGSLALKRVRASYLVLSFNYKSKDVVNNMIAFSKILSYVNTLVRKKNGHIESFTDSEVIVGFNTISKIRYHEVCASTVAISILHGFKSIQNKGNANLISLGLGICCGVTYIGTIGSQKKRSWQSIGEPLDRARLLAKHGHISQTPILFDDSIRSAVNEEHYHYRIADILHFFEEDQPALMVYHLISIQNQDHNWVYEHEVSTFKWSQDYQMAVQYLIADDIVTASDYISQFIDQYPNDFLGLQVKGLIYYLHEMSLSWKQFETSVANSLHNNPGRDYYAILNHRSFVSSSISGSLTHHHDLTSSL